MNLWEKAQAFEDLSDAELAAKTQAGGDNPGDTLLLATETQRRLDVRQRYQAQLEKHQAQQQAQQGPDDVISQRVQELTQMGGGITGVDPGMPLEDPRLQQGIATPPNVQALQRAYGGLIPGYHPGGEVGHEHPDPPWFRRDPFAVDELPMAEDLTRAEYDRLSKTVPGTQITVGQSLLDQQRKAEEGSNWDKVGRWITENIPWTGTARELNRERDYLEAQGFSPDQVLSRLKGKKDAIYERHREGRIEGLEGRLSPGDLDYLDMQGEQEEDDGTITTESGRRYTPEEIADVRHERTNIRQLNEFLANGEITLDQFNQAKESLIASGALGAEAEGDPDDWIRAIMEGQQADRRSMYQTARGDIQAVQDSILNRTEADEAYNELRRKDADLAAYQGERKGIRGLAERDREREYAESRQKLSGDTVQSRRDLLDWDRERIGNLQRGTDMLVGLGPEDDYLRNIHEALGKVSTESTGIEHTALDSIVDQLEQGKTWEKEDFDQVFTTGETAQDQIDRALADRQLFGTTRAGEEANRERETLERLLDPRLKLGLAGMGEEGANYRARLAESGAQSRAEQAARVNLTNYAADPSKWPDIEILYDDVIGLFESDDPMVKILRDAKLGVGVGMAESLRAGQEGDLPVTSEQRDRRVGITSPTQAKAMIEALSASGALSQLPPEMLAEIARLGGG
tara:strand:+ start:665 stop:2725 length:2061 start_codon:yes stop_codon:yes gene_type:complete